VTFRLRDGKKLLHLLKVLADGSSRSKKLLKIVASGACQRIIK